MWVCVCEYEKVCINVFVSLFRGEGVSVRVCGCVSSGWVSVCVYVYMSICVWVYECVFMC